MHDSLSFFRKAKPLENWPDGLFLYLELFTMKKGMCKMQKNPKNTTAMVLKNSLELNYQWDISNFMFVESMQGR